MSNRMTGSLIELGVFVAAIALVLALRRGRADYSFLFLAVFIFVVHEVLLVRAYGLIPEIPVAADSNWAWSGKIYATLGMLGLLALVPSVSLRDAGVTLRHAKGGWLWGGALTFALCAILTYAALQFPPSAFEGDWDSLAFQLTMPGIEEELFYRGVLLLFLDRAFGTPLKLAEAPVGWGIVIAAVAFGMPHGVSVTDAGAAFDWAHAGYTFVAAFILGWLRARTGSLLLPLFIHSYGNSIFYLI